MTPMIDRRGPGRGLGAFGFFQLSATGLFKSAGATSDTRRSAGSGLWFGPDISDELNKRAAVTVGAGPKSLVK